jgi:2-oxoisovalerate dehydrogenase E1 component alpha subunit
LSKIPKFAKSFFFSGQRGFKQFSKPYEERDIAYSSKLDFTHPHAPIPEFRVIDLEGEVISPKYENIEKNTLLKIFDTMIRLEEMDSFLLMSQRQGKISFYMTSHGESAITIATGAALNDEDLIFPQYREQGTLMWRGFEVQQFVDQCMGNIRDVGKGRQMPVHYGSAQHHYMTVSSPLGE